MEMVYLHIEYPNGRQITEFLFSKLSWYCLYYWYYRFDNKWQNSFHSLNDFMVDIQHTCKWSKTLLDLVYIVKWMVISGDTKDNNEVSKPAPNKRKDSGMFKLPQKGSGALSSNGVQKVTQGQVGQGHSRNKSTVSRLGQLWVRPNNYM